MSPHWILYAHDLHYIPGVKAGNHSYLFQQIQEADHTEHMTSYERHHCPAGVVHRFRFVHDVPSQCFAYGNTLANYQELKQGCGA